MIPLLRGRQDALEPFGWNTEDTEWVAMVCLNSGVFTRAQYSAFFNAHPQQAARFVQSLVGRRLAVEEPIPVIRPQNCTRVCRITDKGIYQALEIPKVRRRRFADPAGYLPAALRSPPPNCAIGARRTNTSGRYCGSADSRFTSPPSRSISTPTIARETC